MSGDDLTVNPSVYVQNATTPKVKEQNDVANAQGDKKPVETDFQSPNKVLDHLANSSQYAAFTVKSRGSSNALEQEFLSQAQAHFGVNASPSVDDNSRISIGYAVNKAMDTMFKYEEAFIREFGISGESAQDTAIMAFGQKYLV